MLLICSFARKRQPPLVLVGGRPHGFNARNARRRRSAFPSSPHPLPLPFSGLTYFLPCSRKTALGATQRDPTPKHQI